MSCTKTTMIAKTFPLKKIDPADLVQQLSRSRIYQDYERAFGKTAKLPLKLSSIDMLREVDRVPSKYTGPFCIILAHTREKCAACLQVPA